MTVPVLVDCDPGVDDAIALLLALASPELEVLGVTAVAGNQTLERTTANALRVVELAGRDDVPVAAGANRPLVRELVVAKVHGESGLGGWDLPEVRGAAVEEHAVDLLARVALASPEPVTLVALGPLTNVALLIALHPEAATRLARIVLMGGAIGAGNVTPLAEFNVWADPEAAARVFSSGLDVTMVGLDVTLRACMTATEVGRLGPGRVARFAAHLYESYESKHVSYRTLEGAPIHDAVAVAAVVRPELLTLSARHVEVGRGSEAGRGQTVVDMRDWSLAEPTASVAVGIDAPGFLELLVERLNSLP
ncbi:MAG: nucleoside hydrolase [Gaiellales bacterium]